MGGVGAESSPVETEREGRSAGVVVPSMVHQLWKGRCIPEKWAPFVATWGNQPALTHYVLWTDAAMDRFVLGLFDCTILSYVWRYLSTDPGGSRRQVKEMVKRSDLFRMLLMYVYGGVYADMDIRAKTADIVELLKRGQSSKQPRRHPRKQAPTTKQQPYAHVVWEPLGPQHAYHMKQLPTLPSNTPPPLASLLDTPPSTVVDTAARRQERLEGRTLFEDGRLVLIAFLASGRAQDPFFRFALERQLEWMMVRAVADSRGDDPWWHFRRGLGENAVTETGPSIVARALHSFRAKSRKRVQSARGGGGDHDDFGDDAGFNDGGADDAVGDDAGAGFGGVHAMSYNSFASQWAVHHGSCSWCGTEGPKSKKYSGQKWCLDVEDLVPPEKLRMPYSAYEPSRPLAHEADPSRNRASSLLWVAALNGRHSTVASLLQARGLQNTSTAATARTTVTTTAAKAAAAVVAAVDFGPGSADEVNGAGQTPLYLAAARGHVAVAELLLRHGALVEGHEGLKRHENGDGRSPLHAASAGGHETCVALLLAWGADRLVRFNEETPEDVARRLGHTRTAETLAAFS